MDYSDERRATANAMMELSDSVTKQTSMLDRVRIEIRETAAASDERERGFTDALLRVYERLAVLDRGVVEVKQQGENTGKFPLQEKEKSGAYLAIGGWRIPLGALWNVAKVAIPAVLTGLAGWFSHHFHGH